MTPIFTKAMGTRLEIVRMQMLRTQVDIAMLFRSHAGLEVHQTTISKLETGRIKVGRDPFTMSQLMQVFGDQKAKWIVLGTDEDWQLKEEKRKAAIKYWPLKNKPKGNRKKKSNIV